MEANHPLRSHRVSPRPTRDARHHRAVLRPALCTVRANRPSSVTTERDAIGQTIRKVLAGGPPVRLALIFGSAARGVLRPDSDLDIGMVPSDAELTLAAELDLQARLERACARPVDLVRLDRASTLLRWEAARCAIPVVAHPPQEFPRFLARAAIEHAEFMETYAPAAERYRRRLLEKLAAPASTLTDLGP
jgi:predicted nucleotidyltransferase